MNEDSSPTSGTGGRRTQARSPGDEYARAAFPRRSMRTGFRRRGRPVRGRPCGWYRDESTPGRRAAGVPRRASDTRETDECADSNSGGPGHAMQSAWRRRNSQRADGPGPRPSRGARTKASAARTARDGNGLANRPDRSLQQRENRSCLGPTERFDPNFPTAGGPEGSAKLSREYAARASPPERSPAATCPACRGRAWPWGGFGRPRTWRRSPG